MHMGWSDTGSVPTRVGANVTDDHSRARWVPAPERNVQLARWRHTSTGAGNHDTLQHFAVRGRTPPVLESWHKSPCWQFWPGDQSVTASGLSRGSNSFETSQRRQLVSGITLVPCQIKQSAVSIDRARDLQSQEQDSAEGRWELVKSMVRYERSARLTKTFHESPERLPKLSYTPCAHC